MKAYEGAVHDTNDLIAAVRALVKEYGANDGHVSENHHIGRDAASSWCTWHGQVWFDRAAGDAESTFGESQSEVLASLRRLLEHRKGDPVRRRDVMPDKIDEDPVDDSLIPVEWIPGVGLVDKPTERAELEAASSVECGVYDSERDQRPEER